MTASRNTHRSGSTRGVKKRTVEQRVNAKRATAHLYVPDRGDVDPHTGEEWEGFDRMKIKSLTLTQAEQADNSTNERVLASGNTNAERAVDTDHVKDGAMTDDKISAMDVRKLNKGGDGKGALDAGLLPSSVIQGKVKAANEIDWGAGRPVPSGKVGKGYNYTELKNKPALGAFVKKSELKPNAFK